MEGMKEWGIILSIILSSGSIFNYFFNIKKTIDKVGLLDEDIKKIKEDSNRLVIIGLKIDQLIDRTDKQQQIIDRYIRAEEKLSETITLTKNINEFIIDLKARLESKKDLS